MGVLRTSARFAVLALALVFVAACSQTKDLGKPPELTPVGAGIHNQLPPPMIESKYPGQPINKYSTWSDRQATLFTARRALFRGDTLTVLINIRDRARLESESDRSRSTGRSWGIGGDIDAGGLNGSASANAGFNGETDFEGSGGTSRSENINLRVAAFVVDVLENGYLVIKGSQEVRVNAEVRVLTVAGVVRPADIDPQNTIAYDRIAEARISYGGVGYIAEVQQPPYGQQFIDRISPF